jgi:hypothetical protein
MTLTIRAALEFNSQYRGKTLLECEDDVVLILLRQARRDWDQYAPLKEAVGKWANTL